MSANVNEIYIANPASSFQGTDLFYLGRSPYAPGNDMACTFTTLQTGLFPWTTINVASMTFQVNNGYINIYTGGPFATFSLPAIAAVGSIIRLVGNNTVNYVLTTSAGQTIFMGSQSTTVSISPNTNPTYPVSYIELTCITANTTFLVTNANGAINLN